MKLIVFLGNIGRAYEKTYHNVGFLCSEAFAKKYDVKFNKSSSNCFYSVETILGQRVICAKPTTYMNLSGNTVNYFMQKQKLAPSDCLVIFDDVDLPMGEVRFRKDGSGGTHNGMKNIVLMCGQEVKRLKIGINKDRPATMNLADFVLSRIDDESMQILEKSFEQATIKIEQFIKGEI